VYGKDPEHHDVQRAEEARQRQQEYAQFHNIFSHGRRNQQNIESATQTLTAHNYEVPLRDREAAIIIVVLTMHARSVYNLSR
jgi:hypothetical protein